MKVNLRPAIWATALFVAVTVFGTPKLAVAYQSQDGDQNGRGHDQQRNKNLENNQYFQRGLNNGRDDGANNRPQQYRMRPDNDFERRAYEMGYNQGYQNSYRRNGAYRYGDRQNGYGQNGNPGYQMGFQDGSTDGHNDRIRGRRMKFGLGYKHPDRGYRSDYGNKRAYERQYREAYQRAYRESYNGRGHDDRR